MYTSSRRSLLLFNDFAESSSRLNAWTARRRAENIPKRQNDEMEATKDQLYMNCVDSTKKKGKEKNHMWDGRYA